MNIKEIRNILMKVNGAKEDLVEAKVRGEYITLLLSTGERVKMKRLLDQKRTAVKSNKLQEELTEKLDEELEIMLHVVRK